MPDVIAVESKNVSRCTSLHVEVVGNGPDLVLLHGWGLNSACWQSIIPLLSTHYRLHLVDLPGFGFSHDNYAVSCSLVDITNALVDVVPAKAVWLGWSLGGLCATHFALQYPQRVAALVTVASSPKFMATAKVDDIPAWPGIAEKVLAQFQQQLQENLPQTINRFLAIQGMGSETAKQDIKQLKSLLAARPQPHEQALSNGLKLLESVDLRADLSSLTMPFYRCYGRLDSLVPQTTVAWMDNYLPQSQRIIFKASSHAPFISEPGLFVDKLQTFLNNSL
ncbi:pimeloyl-ACP methyl ester esterase BioH [Moritella marina ATCC 15381]|uniref:Pimeloyl-[acyl-carrier protein] methyl ester esterase n=1 Tax=Moritella marina ATCC 15381 TaxID=1202962 RepID=A0A5J6WNH1_MORMI|nr:pimeloyl-ACP methyl ester esterase BioH [Moritella marina]QFI39703.1 pimeloyl-ACP methyl ester esterase BioH [Moritella marina ATCC 15381]